ncbi:hypothetical protein AOL_s00054g558 [Orbilia oligospora ATCC 24927]|uniref:Programmed cell death protein 2 C-terminal domain-containing protein n=1 Tax=Arthrobotrys oligospora (strain ATCC 24927 / CBS 115.81 / DSM 1491) TaxID=756982 RepID=G1X6R4_ARTOA|nr:hypothetical protein AOL_s00054g558 [Orbilia oligospora ATCC 24927]EGX51182.1 hypothetical protein AOL_s00054g558 [Orbilia oligospora ATCC 24927]
MADYDSDEDVADLEYTTTTTLLGYAEPTPSDDTTSHLGGIPTWFDDAMDSRLAKCLSCNNLMPLLLQLDGNLPDSPHHTRMLYLFGCRSKPCRKKKGSIRAIRGVKSTGITPPNAQQPPAAVAPVAETKVEEQKPKSNMGDMIFGGSSSGAPTNPFATSQSNPFAKPNPFAKDEVTTLTKTFAQAASISTSESKAISKPEPVEPTLIGPPSPWPPASSIPQYTSFYLDASYEELEPDALTLQSQKLAKTIKMDTSDDMEEDTTPSSSKKAAAAASSSSSKASKEKEFESVMNAAFLNFQSMSSQNPEQVLRYERKGIPLLYSRDDSIGKLLADPKSGANDISLSKVPLCSNCGRGRCFEIQLMPHAISVLEEGTEGALDEGMVWGTIIVGTCEADCPLAGSDKGAYVEEWVGVQWETD